MEATDFYLEPYAAFDCKGRGYMSGGPGQPSALEAGAGHAAVGGACKEHGALFCTI